MIAVKVTVKSNRLPQMPAAAKRGVAKGFASAKEPTLSIVRSQTPERSGDLKESETVDSDDKSLTVTAGGGDVDYALFVHNGTTKMRANPYLDTGIRYAAQKVIVPALADGIASEMT